MKKNNIIIIISILILLITTIIFIISLKKDNKEKNVNDKVKDTYICSGNETSDDLGTYSYRVIFKVIGNKVDSYMAGYQIKYKDINTYNNTIEEYKQTKEKKDNFSNIAILDKTKEIYFYSYEKTEETKDALKDRLNSYNIKCEKKENPNYIDINNYELKDNKEIVLLDTPNLSCELKVKDKNTYLYVVNNSSQKFYIDNLKVKIENLNDNILLTDDKTIVKKNIDEYKDIKTNLKLSIENNSLVNNGFSIGLDVRCKLFGYVRK